MRIVQQTTIRLLASAATLTSLCLVEVLAADAANDYAEGIGARMGAWFFFPSVTTYAFYDSNVFSSQTDVMSDFGVLISPRLVAESNFSRHALRIEGGLDGYLYFNETSENRVDGYIRADGELDVQQDAVITTSLGAALRSEDRGVESAPLITTSEPVRYSDLDAAVVGRKTFNRFRFSLGGGIRSLDFQDTTVAATGLPLDQDFRDANIYQVDTRASYEISPGHQIYGDFAYNWRRYWNNTPLLNSDSEGFRVLAGLEFEITRMISGEVGAGYFQQDYVQSGFPDSSGFSYSIDMLWDPTPLIDVRIEGDRMIGDIVSSTSPGRVDTTLAVEMDYEFRRNLILTPRGMVQRSEFEGSPRDDWIWEAGLEVEYILNRYFSMGGNYLYRTRDSNIGGLSYNRHILGMNAKAKF